MEFLINLITNQLDFIVDIDDLFTVAEQTGTDPIWALFSASLLLSMIIAIDLAIFFYAGKVIIKGFKSIKTITLKLLHKYSLKRSSELERIRLLEMNAATEDEFTRKITMMKKIMEIEKSQNAFYEDFDGISKGGFVLGETA
jgi:hypothetical protein